MMETIMAEHAFCGAVLTDTDAVFWPEARSFLSVDDFTDPECKAIFEAACSILDKTGEASRVAIARAAGITNSAALDYMTQNPTGTNAVELARMIHSDAIARAAADVCNGLERRFLAGGEDVQGLLTEATQSIERLFQGEAGENGADAAAAVQAMMERRERLSEGGMLKTFPTLDKFISGFAKGRFYIIGARTGVGKTSLALALGQMLAKKSRVLYISMEMDRATLAERLVSSVSGVPYSVFGRKDLGEQQERMIYNGEKAVSKLKLYIRDEKATVSQIGAWARVYKADVAIVDYIGLMKRPGRKEYDEISEISVGLKQLAMRLDIPIIGLCQMNRSQMETADKKPELHMLRSSGSLEQDCDVALLLDCKTQEGAKPWDAKEMVIYVAKNRHGMTGNFSLTWYSGSNRFVDDSQKGVVKNSWD